jgi:hypothetical protein
MTHPSIYDRSLDALRQNDWSRPLVVQACRTPVFRETVSVMTERLGLEKRNVTVLIHASSESDLRWSGRRLVNTESQLSPDTHTRIDGFDPREYSVMVVVTQAPLHDSYESMRRHSGVGCFCHALAALPTLLVNPAGHISRTPTNVFGLREHAIGSRPIFGTVHLSQPEMRALYESSLLRPDGAVVEIGRFAGGSAMVLASAGRDGGRRGVISIDIERLPAVDYLLTLNGFTAEDITLLDIDAKAAAGNWGTLGCGAGISLLFIDADHSYEGVQRDLRAWTPHLVAGALVAFHDVNNAQFGVTRAVYDEVYRNPRFAPLEQIDSLLIARFDGSHRGAPIDPRWLQHAENVPDGR